MYEETPTLWASLFNEMEEYKLRHPDASDDEALEACAHQRMIDVTAYQYECAKEARRMCRDYD